ncbi:DUF1501 domain-containing protein [Stieleria varia]|uniref:DUF1501 domain-containing protein n=1 Tax=Stieleria varia TaxID=2528005 RepID=UPI0036F2D49A
MQQVFVTTLSAFLVASASGFAGLHFGTPAKALADRLTTLPDASNLRGGGQAKSVILFFLCGGASHVDTWDMKPDAPAEYRGPFQPISTPAPGVQCCEHLPLLAKQAHGYGLAIHLRTIAASAMFQMQTSPSKEPLAM